MQVFDIIGDIRRLTAGTTRRALLAAVPLAMAAMVPSAANAQEQTFKIGFLMSLTGPNAILGKIALTGAEAGIDMINESGGIGGMKAELVICDAQSVEQQAVICARKLAMQDKVQMILGTGSTPQTLAITPTVEAAGIPLFAVASGPSTYTPVKKWVFKGISGQADTIPPEVAYLKKKGMLRIAMIHDNGPLGADISSVFKESIKGTGIEIVDTQVYAPSDTDVTAQVTRMRASKPDAVLNVAVTPPAGAMIAKTMNQLGMNVPIIVGQNLQSASFANLAGESIDQVVFPASQVVVNELPANDPLAANIKKFREHFAKRNAGEAPSSLSPWMVDAMLLAQKAAQPLGKKALEPAALRDAIEGLKDVKGIQGVWSFSAQDHGSDLSAGIILVKFADKQWVAVD
jgi:branched-chain amino acid transport system substrate-binding protein